MDSGSIISFGGQENVSGGVALSGIVDGGTMNVAPSATSGGIASATVVRNGGELTCRAGGRRAPSRTAAGGTENVSSGGTASGTVISTGGIESSRRAASPPTSRPGRRHLRFLGGATFGNIHYPRGAIIQIGAGATVSGVSLDNGAIGHAVGGVGSARSQ